MSPAGQWETFNKGNTSRVHTDIFLNYLGYTGFSAPKYVFSYSGKKALV